MAFVPPSSNWNDISLILRANIDHEITVPEGDGDTLTTEQAINWLGNKLFTLPFTYVIGTDSTFPIFNLGANNILTLNIPMANISGVTAGLISNTDYVDFKSKFPGPTGTADQYVRGNGTVGTPAQGLTTNEDHNLTLDLAAKTLVSPTISTTWTLYDNDGTTPYETPTSTDKNIIVDKGVVAYISSSFQYPIPFSTEAVPTSVFGDYGTAVPPPQTPSATFTNSGNPITTTTTYSETLVRAKSGLIVQGSQVVFASGNNTTSDSTSISFLGRGCMIFSSSSSLNAGAIEAVLNTNSFQSTRSRTFNTVTAGAGNYTYYVYDAALGSVTNVIQNDAQPVFGAFSFLTSVVITNAAGYSMSVIVMRSNATNAFTNAKLDFS